MNEQTQQEVPYADVVNDENTTVVDAFSIPKELRDLLLKHFEAAIRLDDSDIEALYAIYNGVKNALPTKLTITRS